MKTIVFLGGNDFKFYKRGVENVMWFQSRNHIFDRKIHIALSKSNAVYKWRDIICISIKRDSICYLRLNLLILRLRHKYQNVFIHSHSPVLSLMLYCKSNLLTVHDAIYYQRKSQGQKIYPIFAIVEYLSAFKVNHIHYISEFTKSKSLLKCLFKNKFSLIYNTTPLENLEVVNIPNIEMKKDEISIFTVRGIQKRNRIDLLYDFCKSVESERIDGKKIHLYVAGKGELLDYYKDKVSRENLSNFTFLGYVDDNVVLNYYLKADIIIVVTEVAEGFGLPVIEGYLFDKPVIASNRCAIPEIIIKNDYLFENNAKSILDTLRKNLTKYENYKSYYLSKFSSEIILAQYDEMYQKLLNYR